MKVAVKAKAQPKAQAKAKARAEAKAAPGPAKHVKLTRPFKVKGFFPRNLCDLTK